ncbi:MAG: UBP-type zinc finger domain-containing protein [Actinomycetota bacterium]
MHWRYALNRGSTGTACTHVTDRIAAPRAQSCEECGSTFNLRVCTECGHVGCCESQLAHNTAHARQSGHPVIKSMPVSERSFTWSYACGTYV